MKPKAKIKSIAAVLFFGALNQCDLIGAPDATNAPAMRAPVSARDFFNAGTQRLSAGKFSDAEKMFQAALARQDEAVQPSALYNLGQTRFAQGAGDLKKTPAPARTKAMTDRALESVGDAIRSGEAALATNDLQQTVDAYLRGRGARRELRAAFAAVGQALQTYGGTLQKWSRARGDFQGASELNPADTNAAYNVSVVEKNIAALVDSLQQMQTAAAGAAQESARLDGLLGQLKGKIPGGQLPPGADADDADESPGGLSPEELAGTAEKAVTEGSQMELTLLPDEAGNLLDGLQTGDRRLPSGQGDAGGSKIGGRRDW